MGFKEMSIMSQRLEFVKLALAEGCNISKLCKDFGISRKSGYKWLSRYQAEKEDGLKDKSKRPHHSPVRSAISIETSVIEMRSKHPKWGARKLKRRLEDIGESMPCVSTIHGILKRHHLIDPTESEKHKAWQRFEHEHPNQLWQMDFKGHIGLTSGERIHPLTILDDHSRFNLCLEACLNEQKETVEKAIRRVFEQYGLPERMTMDNGSPWGDCGDNPYTQFTVWLIRLGIKVSHSRPYHPQTQGKDERFHRSLKAEVISGQAFDTQRNIQEAFDKWRSIYNHERPHEALQMGVPAMRYTASSRAFPSVLPPIEYADKEVRKVQKNGVIFFRGKELKVGKAFVEQPVAIRPTDKDCVFEIYFCQKKIKEIDLCSTDNRNRL